MEFRWSTFPNLSISPKRHSLQDRLREQQEVRRRQEEVPRYPAIFTSEQAQISDVRNDEKGDPAATVQLGAAGPAAALQSSGDVVFGFGLPFAGSQILPSGNLT